MITLELDLADFRAQLNGVANDLRGLPYDRVLKRCAILIRNDLGENVKAGKSPDGTPYKPLRFPRPNGKTSPLWDTGALVRSLGSTGGEGHVESISGDTLTIGTNLEYAALHQYGGTIKPVNVQWLTIPMTPEAKRAGSARDFPRKLEFVAFGRGKAALRERRQKGKKGKVKTVTHYLLVKEVTVPARPFMGFSDKVVGQIEDEIILAL